MIGAGRHKRRARPARRLTRRGLASGQSLVEFSLILPVFTLMLMGLIEFGFLYNSVLTVQFAARQGVSAAAQVGGEDGADCAILKAVEAGLTVPIDKNRVAFVDVFQSDTNGNPIPGVVNHYLRGGSLDCPGTQTQPYTLQGTEGYPQTARHDALSEGLDIVGVSIGYTYLGITPIGAGRSWVVSDGATLRMEPKQ
jgi:hypothetical protein